MFGVVVCPKCRRARGVVLGSSRAKCPRCGRSIDLSKARIFYKTDSQAELAAAVKKMMERLNQGIEDIEVEKKRRSPVKAGTKKRTPRTEDGLVTAARALTETSATFGPDDFAAQLGLKDEKEASALIERMLKEGLLLEPRPGRYRVA